MSQKGIIINTSDSGHVDASDHAILFKAIFGVGGILNVGKKLEILTFLYLLSVMR